MPPVYKHVAPLGLKTRFLAFPFSLRSLCLCSAFITHHVSRISTSKICPIKHVRQSLTPPMQQVLIYGLWITRRDLHRQGCN